MRILTQLPVHNMKRISPVLPLVTAIFVSTIQVVGQSTNAEQSRPRIVSPVAQQTTQTTKVSEPANTASTADGTNAAVNPDSSRQVALPLLSPAFIQTRINEAQRLLKSRPLATAMTAPSIDFVTVVALDQNSSRTHLLTFPKQTFLTKGSELTITSSLGTPLTVRVLRANGVNTALTVFTPQGQSLVPLIVEYPIERNGLFREMAYTLQPIQLCCRKISPGRVNCTCAI